jgi:4-hydroxymandelate oxidase
MSAPSLHKLPAGLLTLRDHETYARKNLNANAFAYFCGGAADEITLKENQDAWQQYRLQPRVLKNLTGGHTRTTILGQTLAHPIMLAPVAFQKMAHPDGELATAYAAAMQSTGMILSTQSSTHLATIASAIINEPTRGPLWFQLYMQHDRHFTRDLVAHAESAGYEALVLTVDAPASGARDRERRANFKVPAEMRAVNLDGLPPLSHHPLAEGQSAMFDGLLRYAPTWDDIAWLKSITQLPIILKGILHPEDAQLGYQSGAAGIIVSNHGGRTLDTAIPSAWALQSIREALPHDVPVLVDGGIRRGTDVLKAMALGASAVLIGRPYVYGLANAGALGVAHVIRLLRDELEIAMALSGCATLSDATPALLYQKNNFAS